MREPQRQDRKTGWVVTAAKRLSLGQEAAGRHWKLGAIAIAVRSGREEGEGVGGKETHLKTM